MLPISNEYFTSLKNTKMLFLTLNIYQLDQNQRPPKDYIAFAYTRVDSIYYSHWDPAKLEASKFCDDNQESFNDAVKIVMQQENQPQLQRLLAP